MTTHKDVATRTAMRTPGAPAAGVNMADVAAHAGVSTATVSRALRDLPGVGEATRLRIKEIARDLAYVVSPEASGLARGATGRVAVVVPRLDIWFYGTLVAAIEQAMREAGTDVLVYQVDGPEQRARFFEELPARRKVDALILCALPLLAEEQERLDLISQRVVIAGGRLHDHAHVVVDDHDVATAAVRHLLDLGHRRIAMIRTSDAEGAVWSSDALRTRGYRDALGSAGIEVDPDLLVTVTYSARSGAEGLARLLALPEPPTAVFAYSDEIGLGALEAARRSGLEVPGDLSIIGVDGHPLGEVYGLTTIDQTVAEQGRRAGRLALDLIGVSNRRPDRDQVLGTRLVLRDTTGRCPTG